MRFEHFLGTQGALVVEPWRKRLILRFKMQKKFSGTWQTILYFPLHMLSCKANAFLLEFRLIETQFCELFAFSGWPVSHRLWFPNRSVTLLLFVHNEKEAAALATRMADVHIWWTWGHSYCKNNVETRIAIFILLLVKLSMQSANLGLAAAYKFTGCIPRE